MTKWVDYKMYPIPTRHDYNEFRVDHGKPYTGELPNKLFEKVGHRPLAIPTSSLVWAHPCMHDFLISLGLKPDDFTSQGETSPTGKG